YGPWGRPDMAPMLFTDAILHDRAIKVFNFGKMSRDFTYIDDIVEGLINVIDCPATKNDAWDPEDPEIQSSSAPYRIYNIGNNAPVDLMKFIETIENSLGKTAEKNMLPIQPGDVESTYADTSELMKDFNYKPDTLLDKGVSEFTKWYREFYNIKESK
ncbi:MAG: NAD-dependent epimerase/dehydratase family protein, partial [Bacteroidota bacterium]